MREEDIKYKVSKKLDKRKAETDGRVWIPSKMFRQTPHHLEDGILSQPSAPGKKLLFVLRQESLPRKHL